MKNSNIATEDDDYVHEDSDASEDSSDSDSEKVVKRGGEQYECAIIGCKNGVTNRLRFSLRTHKKEDYKPEFIEVCFNLFILIHYRLVGIKFVPTIILVICTDIRK